MDPKPQVFVDSDVVVSGLLSSTGAANLILKQTSVKLYISNLSHAEITEACVELNIPQTKFKSIQSVLTKTIINETKEEISTRYGKFASDPQDTHIVLGAHKSQTSFLLTYNLRHYKIELIKRELNIVIMTPGQFLQYLRSKS